MKLLVFSFLICFLIVASEYSVQKDGSICLSCPLIKEDDVVSKITYWRSLENNNMKVLCRNQMVYESKTNNNAHSSIIYTCEKNQICLKQFKSSYPKVFQCSFGEGIVAVNVSYYGKFFLKYLYSLYKLSSFETLSIYTRIGLKLKRDSSSYSNKISNINYLFEFLWFAFILVLIPSYWSFFLLD